MEVLLLSRLQFTATTIFHFFFVPLTLGLSVLVAIMETQYARTGNETYLKMTKFWGNLSAIWILIANGWMQQPVGYAIRNGRAVRHPGVSGKEGLFQGMFRLRSTTA